MAKQLTKPEATNVIVDSPKTVPAHLQPLGKLGIERLSQYVLPPMLKVVQKQSSDELLTKFGMGSVIANPGQKLVFDPGDGTPFDFITLFFYVEFCAWNPIEKKGQLNAIRERTLDETSELAMRARDPMRWLEPLPRDASDEKQLFIRNVEHLNFLVLIEGIPDLDPLPHIISFCRGEHKTGRYLSNLVSMRNAPICGCRFSATTSQGGQGRSNAKGSWSGLDIVNANEPWVGPDLFPKCLEQFRFFEESFKGRTGKTVRATYDDDMVIDPVDNGDASNENRF